MKEKKRKEKKDDWFDSTKREGMGEYSEKQECEGNRINYGSGSFLVAPVLNGN